MKPIAIDLGLSVRWADRNLGAENPGQPGEHFYQIKELRDGAEVTEFYNKLIKKKIGDRWRLPTVKEVLELERCTMQLADYPICEGRATACKLTSFNKNHIFLIQYCSNLVAGPAFFTLDGRYYPELFIADPSRNSFYNHNYTSSYITGYYALNADIDRYTQVHIRPVTEAMPTITDKFRKLSEEDVFSTAHIYPQKAISIKVLHDFTEEEYRQYLEAERKHQEWQKEYDRRRKQEEEEKKKQDLLAGKVYHKVQFTVDYWKGDPYESAKGFAMDTRLVRHDELMAIIGGGMSARKAWLASKSSLLSEEIITVEIAYNLSKAYDKNGNLLSDDY